jgi:hypothetical protein
MEKREMKTPDQILQMALAKEKEARDFYDAQATHCPVDFVRKLLEKLKTFSYGPKYDSEAEYRQRYPLKNRVPV